MGIVYLFIHYSVCAFCCCCCFTILSLIIIPALKSVSDNFNIWISLSLFSIDCPFSDFNSHFHISSNFGFYLVVILQTFRMIHMTVFPVCWLWGQMQPGQKRGFCWACVCVFRSRCFLAGLPASTTSLLKSVPNVARSLPRIHNWSFASLPLDLLALLTFS